VITGARDVPDFHAIGNRLAAGLPRAHPEIIESSGHLVNLEAPDIFNQSLLEFWRGLKGA
jgi:pimeloyl-ACP methyl ester carboxylesterase